MRIDDNMKKIREEIYINAVKNFNDGMKAYDVCKKYGLSESAFYAWKAKFENVGIDKIKEIREEVKEEKKLRKKIKEQEIIIKALRTALKKKF